MTPEQSELLYMVLGLVSTMIGGGVVAGWVFKNYFNLPLILGSFVVSIAMIFVMHGVSDSGNVMLIHICAFIFGGAVAADIGGLALLLGAQRGLSPETTFKGVMIAFGITLITTLVAGVIAIESGLNFQGLGPWLMMGLFLLIGIGLAGMVGLGSARADYAIGILASAFWAVYMVYDLNKVVDKYDTASWPAAVEISMGLYLDMINFLIRILPYVLDAMSK